MINVEIAFARQTSILEDLDVIVWLCLDPLCADNLQRFPTKVVVPGLI